MLLIKDYKITVPVYIVSILLLSLTLFFDTWKSLVEIWMRSDTYAYGFIIIPASFFLIWQNKSLHKDLRLTKPSLLGLIFIILNGLFWQFAVITQTIVIQQVALVGTLIGSYWFYLGNSTTKKIIFPLVFLYLMIPAGEEALIPYLREYTTTFTVALLRLTGISVYREGFDITLVSGKWSVVEACAGLRYLMAFITLGSIYAYITYSKTYKRILFILLSLIIPIIANGLRAYLIVMIGHLSNMRFGTGPEHVVYGVIFFAIILFIIFFIGSFWEDSEITTEKTSNVEVLTNTYTKKQNSLVILTLLLSLSIWPFSSRLLQSNYHAQVTIPEWPALTRSQQWREVKTPDWNWQPKLSGATVESLRYFKKNESIIGLYQANFGDEKQGAELVNRQNVLITIKERKKWHFIKESTLTLTNPENQKSITVDIAELRGDFTNIIAVKWYQVGSLSTNNQYLAKIYQLYKRLTLDTTPEIYYVVFTNQLADKNTSFSVIQEFITHLFLIKQDEHSK